MGQAVPPLQNTQSATTPFTTRGPKDFGRNGLEPASHPVQTFRVAEEQISIGSQVTPQPVDDFQFCFPLKINDDVAAKDQVERAKDVVMLLDQIQPLKTHRF